MSDQSGTTVSFKIEMSSYHQFVVHQWVQVVECEAHAVSITADITVVEFEPRRDRNMEYQGWYVRRKGRRTMDVANE
jgi:hypothetical protein